VVTHDRHLPLYPPPAGRPVGGQHVDAETVVLGEGRRLRVQRDRLASGDVQADHRLCAVIDDRAGHATEVRHARRWQSKNVPRSWLATKPQNGSPE